MKSRQHSISPPANALDCEACKARSLRNKGGDAFNPTAHPGDDGLENLGEWTTSFKSVKDYFSAHLRRCEFCGTFWLLGYYEDFDARPPESEWGERKWIWRPLTSEQVEEVRAASGTSELDIDTFAA
jgi:hypothetical protein